MRTLQIKDCKCFKILILLLLGMARLTGYAQELQTPYPIIFVHGLVGDRSTWGEEGNQNSIINILHNNAGLTFGGFINVNLNSTLNNIQYSINCKKDVEITNPNEINRGDYYIINYHLHSSLGISLFTKPLSFLDPLAVILPISTERSFLVTKPENFRIGDIIRIEQEIMEVTNIESNKLTVIRGIWDSPVGYHTNVGTYERIYNLSTEGNQSSITKQGYGLKIAIDKIKEINSNIEKVILVGHSMGGLACREYIRTWFNNDVAKIVTIGTPHYGSYLASNVLVNLSPVSTFYIDLRSDAIRDLSPKSIFLFGGNEANVAKDFYSKDVNCNGILNENIIGLNQDYSHLDEIARTWIVSDYKFGGDLVVGINSQRLAVSDTIMTNRPHITLSDGEQGETKDVLSLVRGLDEPDEKGLAYEIESNSISKGFITYQQGSIDRDVDLYKIVLNKGGHLKINLTADSQTGVKEIDLLDIDLNPIKLVPGINQTLDEILNGNVPIVVAGAGIIEMDLESGTYYIQIIGKASENTYRNPYILQTEFTLEVVAKMTVSTTSIQYFDVLINSPKDQTIKLTNNGTSDILVTGIAFTGTDADQFTAAPMPPFAVIPELPLNLKVIFNPTSIGAKAATLEITTNSPDIPKKSVSLKGIGTDHETKFLSINIPIGYTFPDTKINLSKTKIFSLQNTGSSILTVSDLSIGGLNPDPYSITSAPTIPFDIGTGEIKYVTVKYSPTTVGSTIANLLITNNSDNRKPIHYIELKGNGIENYYTSNSYNSLLAYEYWFDDQYSTKVNNRITEDNVSKLDAQIPTDGLETGLHNIHIRYQDIKGKWSGIVSDFFHKLPVTPVGSPKMIASEYWFDADFASKVSTSITPGQAIAANGGFDISSLKNGLHSYHVRYKDDAGQWSSVVSEFFQKLPVAAAGSRTITASEYWFDDDYTTKFTSAISPGQTIITNGGFDVSSLASGLHSYHVRYKDDTGLWSSVVSEFFQKLPVTAAGSRTITASEYWFDDGFASKVSAAITPGQTITANDGFEVGSLANGLHSYHVRYKDDAGQWSSVVSEFFQKLPVAAAGSRTITASEYWFDDDYSTKFTSAISPGQMVMTNGGFDVSSLASGLHSYHVRYKDDTGMWSSVVSEFFQKLPLTTAGSRTIIASEYWFDDGFASKVSAAITPGQTITANDGFDASSLANGLHSYHVRYKDDAGQWSSVVSEFFQKLPVAAAGSRTITASEYWFDDDYSTNVSAAITPGQTISLSGGFDDSKLESGLHSYHVRYKDDAGQWSSVVSEFFQKLPLTAAGSRTIVACEYWFDNGYASKKTTAITPGQIITADGGLDVSALSNGLHSYHVRYKDDAGQWSSVVSEFFQKLPLNSEQNNLIVMYRYWFDSADQAMITVNLPDPLTPYQLVRNINTCSLSDGNHTIHFQFKDSWNLWSAVTTDVITKSGATLAPEITANGVKTFCQGGKVTLTTSIADSYLWSNGATSQSIDVTVSGNFSVTVNKGSACEKTSEATAVVVNPLPSAAGIISGNVNVLKNQANMIYSVPAIEFATSYIWILPDGATGTSTTNSIPVSFGDNALSGEIKVKGHNDCGDGPESSLALSVVSVFTQNIELNTGWNIISSVVVPANLNLKDLFQSLIDAGKLKKVMDETGKTIENFGAFGGWKNNIGNLNSAKGYKVNVLSTSTLSLEGTPVPLPLDIALATGWNIISYPSATAQDAKALVQSLIDSGKLKKVMDEAGKTIENFGAFGGWKNNIGDFVPGEGYKVNVLGNCTLILPANGTKSAIVVPEVLASTHFAKAFIGNGTDHMNIHLVNLQASGLQAGDEIGIYDGRLCVGSATIGAEQLISGNISIPASANDELNETVNGFISSHPVELQLYRGNHAFKLNLAKLSGNELFEKNGSFFVKVTASDLPAIQIENGADQIKCFPNPFSDQLTIEIRLTEPKNLEVKVYDLSGKLVRNLFNGDAGTSELMVWDGTNGNGAKMGSGTYILKANEMVEKVVLKK